MARFVTLTGPARFNGVPTGIMSPAEARAAFGGLLHNRRQQVLALRATEVAIVEFLEARLRHDKRLATQLRVAYGDAVKAKPVTAGDHVHEWQNASACACGVRRCRSWHCRAPRADGSSQCLEHATWHALRGRVATVRVLTFSWPAARLDVSR